MNTKPQSKHEAGQVLVWTLVMLPLLVVIIGLVLDGGLMFVQFRRARWAMDGAAVAAASTIDPTHYAQTGQLKLGSAALDMARRYAQLNDPALHLASVTLQANTVQVRGTLELQPIFLRLFGSGSIRLTVTGQARPAWGIARPGQ